MLRGDRIDALMQDAGLSQAELARRVGVSQPTIYKAIHKGKRGTAYLYRIAAELKTTPAYLSGETDDPALDAPVAPTLSSEDREALELIQRLDPSNRKALLQVMRCMVQNHRPHEQLDFYDPVVGTGTFAARAKSESKRKSRPQEAAR